MKLTLFGARALFFYGVMIVAFFGAPYANLFFLLLGFLSVQWVMAWIWTWRNGVGVEARFGALEPIVAGSCASLAATLTCPRGTRFDLQLNLDLDAERTIAGRLPVLRGTGTVQLHTPALARGVYALRDARLSSTYPFGLLRRRIPVASPDELVVYPAPLDGVAASRSAQDLLAEWMGTGPTGQGDLQPSGLRDHRASDGLRGIHWRASARRGKLVLQEWDGGATQGMEVVLDRRCESEELENSLRELSTLIQLARDSKQALAIRTQGCNETFGEGHGDWGGALRLLAAAEVLPMDGPAPPQPLPKSCAYPGGWPVPSAGVLPAPASVTHRALLLCMVGMVLCNVLFVQLTQAAEPSWLMPLYALALAAPFLDRYKDKLWYRALWNTGVLALFTLLVQHATSRNLEFVLQDGLFLAVLCQVHLLNNLRTDQRPDLLFLNSFLIAVITGYITVDLGFAAAFLVYAPFFLMGMQFLSMVRPGETLEPRVVRAVVWDGVRRSGVLLGLALLVFFFWPRDFDRPALFAEYLDFPTPDGGSEIGFSESLELKRHEGLSNDRRVVLTVQPTSGDVADVPELWRGATLPVHEGRDSWTGLGRVMAQGEAGADPAWYPIPRGLSRQPDEAVTDPETAGIGLRVARLDSSTQRLFLPRDAQTVWLDKRHTQGRLHADGDGTLLYPNPGALYYTVQRKAAATDATPHGRGNSNATEDLGNFVRLNPTTVSRSAVLLARRLRKQLAETAPSSEVVTAFATYLSTQFTYRFPGDPKAAGSLDEFLTTDAGGHCEFFASALATMLRSSQIPCRIVTGYRSSDWNAANRTRTLYNSDAHAWVEVLDPILGWYAVDPTPAGAPQAMGLGWWSSAKGQVAGWWNRITGFDEQSRSAVMAWLQATPGNVLASMERHPLRSTGLGLVCGMALWMLRQRKRRIEPESIRALRKALATAGFEPNGSRTPRELLAGLDTASLSEVQQAGLRQAVEQHERDRYAA